MNKPLMFRPVGEAKYFGNRGTAFVQFLRQKYGELPIDLSTKDIPVLKEWAAENENGEMGILLSLIERYKMVQVGYFEP